MIRVWRAVHQRAEVLSLILLATLPALWSSPGRMSADTKLYLYLDPARLVSDARWSWDPRQFGGWVPHQTISYLWPSGPWFALFDGIGVPDWIAHRLWWSLLLASAGLGARWAARHLGVTAQAAWVVGAVYQLSPFVLPYIARTSLMLAPYAALGWLVGLTVRSATQGGWRYPALFALVVATVAAPNATATAMIAPAPALWLLLAWTSGDVPGRRVLATFSRVGTLSLAVSTWWIAMLAVQGRHGADVLGYSETLEDVSLTATSTEVLRGLGYWLFYVRDAFTYATTASIDYQASTFTLLTSLAVTGLGVAGLALTRWTHRRYAIGLVAVGVVLAVGVYPVDDPSPLMSPLADRSRSALALALRSSTRAVPLVVLGLALGTGALVMAVTTWWRNRTPTGWQRRDPTPWLATAVVMLAVANLPALWRAELLDPALQREQHPPNAWLDAAAALDARPKGYRVLQIPGAEFGAFQWGYTVDPPLPGLTTRPVVTRDLLPLGSPATMDLLYALDDRIQEGVLEVASVAPVARLLGADVVWLTNDSAFDRFGTARPEPLAAALTAAGSGLGPVTSFGEPRSMPSVRPTLDAAAIADPRVGTAVPPVQLVEVPQPLPVFRAATRSVLLAGSGDGLVDSAAAGLLPADAAVRYVASIPADHLDEALVEADRVVVTDTDRRRAHHWRSSQQVWGFTEDEGPQGGVLTSVSGDQRLPVFAPEAASQQTIARQQGGLRAAASAYGAPFSYRPEVRAWRAVDGDLESSWLVADRVDAVGERLRLRADQPVDHLTVVQPLDGRRRWITTVDVVVDEVDRQTVVLDESSRGPEGQRLELPRPGRVVDLVIVATEQIAPGWEHLDAVGFAEIRSELGPTTETVVFRSPALTNTPDEVPLDIVMSRWRADPHDADRGDPEPAMVREMALGTERTLTPEWTLRLNRRASDAVLADLWGWTGATADRRLTGDPFSGGWAAVDGDATTAWRTPFGSALGARLTVPLQSPPDAEAPLSNLRLVQSLDGRHGLITEVLLSVPGVGDTRLPVPPPGPDGSSIIDVSDLLSDASTQEFSLTIASTDGATTPHPTTALPVSLPTAMVSLEHPRVRVGTFPSRLEMPCRDDLVQVNGVGVPLRLEGDREALWRGEPVRTDPCGTGDSEMTLPAGTTTVTATPGTVTGVDVDRLVLRSPSPSSPVTQRPEVTVLRSSRTEHGLQVAACPRGCWLVHGEGFNTGWTASLNGTSLGDPVLMDGGFNAWWLPASDTSQQVDLAWTPQRQVDVGLVISLLAVVLCVVLVLWDRRRPLVLGTCDEPRFVSMTAPLDEGARPRAPLRQWGVWVAFTAVVMLTVEPVWGLAAGAVALTASWWRRPHVAGVAALVTAVAVGVLMVWRVRRDRPFPGPLWTHEFADLHRPGLVMVALLVASLLGTVRPR